MDNLKTLALFTIGAIVLSITFAVATKDRETKIDFDTHEGRSIQHVVNGDRGEFVLREKTRALHAKWDGEFELSADGKSIARLDDELEIELKENDVKRSAEFERDGDEIVKTLIIDGDEQKPGAETDAEIEQLLLKFLRASGLKAEERVHMLLADGGPAAALAEMRRLEGDHAVTRYTIALTEKADLSEDDIRTLIDLISPMESDHDQSRSIRAILEHETISPALTPALISAADGIESDHDLRKIVGAFAERPLTPEAVDLALSLYERIGSDHDLRVAAQALLANKALNDAGAARLLDIAAAQVGSSHDLRLILTESASRFSAGGETAASWLRGLEGVESSHDQRMAITEIAEQGNLSSETWLALIKATEKIDSSHDQRMALVSIAENFDYDVALIDAYRTAAAKIDSQHDREKTIAALGTEEED